MPQAIAAAAYWVGSTVATTLGAATLAVTGSLGAGVAVASGTSGFLVGVSELALWAGMSYAVDVAMKPKLTPAGAELNFNMDPAYPREMIIGERLVGGSMAARYSRGSNLYNAHMVIQVADHPCTELSKVYDGGRVVWPVPLVHGVRTEIEAYSISGGARVWMTWHDGRAGQTADTDLITKSAQDPDVVAGKLPGWSSDHRGAGCAYIHVEVQWDSDILTSIPQFQFLVKGAPLYDRRKDSTAGGSGSHRLDDPSTWEYTDNAAVAADHYLLGYKVEDDDLAFGIGLHPSEVPYEIFANAADLADEDVETGTGGDVETIKRYVVNGVVSAADYFEDVLEAFQIQMAARFVDLGGRIGILGAEERAISLDLTDQDLVADDQMQFADKLSFDDLYGSVSGTFADPANLYQQTPYETQYTPYNALPDGGEAQQIQIALPYEVHPRRAVRNVSAWLKRESLQPRLIGIFMAKAWRLEAGDWFTFTSERLQLDMAKFEVIDIAKHDDFTVTITARAIDPEFLAFSVDDDPDLSVPPDVEPVSLVLDTPAFTPTATTITGGGATEPVIQVVTDAPNPVTRELVIEAQEWNGSALTGPVLFFVGHADNLTSILRQGLKPNTAYKVRMKARAGARESAWSAWSSPVTTSTTYTVPRAGSADSAVPGSALASDIAAAATSSDAAAAAAAASAAAAAAEADAAAASALTASGAATAASGSASAAAGSATSASNSATSAAGSATSAASSATAAAASASGAAGSASAASTSASAASTSASNAATSASAASTSATNAATSAGSAGTSATNAAASATDAAGHASSASSSASAAAASQSAAAGSASAASTSASTASTQASNAATSASAASTSATNAATQASSAGTYATQASNSATTARVTASLQFPPDFQEEEKHWTHGVDGSPTAAADISASYPSVTGIGKVYQKTGAHNLCSKGVIKPVAGRKYRWSVTARRTVDGTSQSIALFGQMLAADYTNISAYTTGYVAAVLAVADGWITRTFNVTGDALIAAGASYVRPRLEVNDSASGVIQVSAFTIEDVTESEAASASAISAGTYASAAAGSASSASSSASTATTQASNASASASSAASSATLAATYYGKGNRNLFPNPSGNGSGASAIGSGLWSGVFGGDTGGSTWKQARYDWLGGNIYLEDWSTYSSGTSRAYYVDIPLTNGGYQNYTVSWIGWKAGFTSAPYVQAYILDSGGGTVATSSAPALDNFYSGVRSSLTVGSSGGTGVTLRLYVVIPAQTVGAYCAAMISQIKLEVGSSMTAFTDDTSVNNLNTGLATANASIASNASAIATESSARAAADTTITAKFSGGANPLGVSDFSFDGLYWYDGFGGAPESVSDPSGGVTYTSVANIGRVMQVTTIPKYITQKAVVRPQMGKRYRVTAEVRATVDATGGSLMAGFAVNGLSSSWAHSDGSVSGATVAGYPQNSALTVAAGWVTIKYDFYPSGISTYDAAWRPRLDLYRTAGSGGTIQVRTFSIEEVSELVATNAQVAVNTSAIATESTARAAADTTLTASLGTTNANVSTNAAAIATINGAAAFWETIVSASGGDLAAVRLKAGASGSYLELISTVLRLANVSNGAVIEVMRAIGGEAYFSRPVSSDGGGKRVTIGPGYGASGSEVVLWFGADSVAPSSQSRTNGYFALGTDGKVYYGAAEIVAPTTDDQTKTGTANFDNIITSGTTATTMATIDLTVGASGYLELLSPLFYGPLSINQESGMTLSAGTDWFGQMIVTEQLQSGGTEHTLWTIPLQISDTGGGLFDFIFDPPVVKVVAQNVSGASRYRIKIQRTSGSNNVSGNGLQGKFTIRRTP